MVFSSDLFLYFLSLVIIGLGMLCLVWISRVYWGGRLRDWAKTQGFRLVSFRGAKFKEGPQTWRSRRSERLFRIAVEDDMQAQRSGWLMYKGVWGVKAPEPAVKILWDEWHD